MPNSVSCATPSPPMVVCHTLPIKCHGVVWLGLNCFTCTCFWRVFLDDMSIIDICGLLVHVNELRQTRGLPAIGNSGFCLLPEFVCRVHITSSFNKVVRCVTEGGLTEASQKTTLSTPCIARIPSSMRYKIIARVPTSSMHVLYEDDYI